MRTFIAIELPKETKDKLTSLQERLKAAGADVKWVEPENIHLTLKFLGERDDKKIAAISAVLEDAGKKQAAFNCRIATVGAFPKLEYPRVIWVGLDQGDQETCRIAEELEEKIARTGIPKEERPFSSHITIGRVRSPAGKDKLIASIKKIAQDLPGISEFRATKIILYKSTLSPKGPVYEPLKEISLAST